MKYPLLKVGENINTIISIVLILICNNVTSQEFMHWKFLEGAKTDRIKTQTVWQYPVSDSSMIQEKTLFSFHQYDDRGRIIALRMYSMDTSFFEYDSTGVQSFIHSNGQVKKETEKTFKYSGTGKILYEFQDGEYGHEYYYSYDSLDRQVKMNIMPAKNEIFNQDTIINTRVYNNSGKDSIRRHFEANILKTETFFKYDDKLNCVRIITCNYSDMPYCDTTITKYNNLGQKIYYFQQWHKYNDTTVQKEIRKWEYDRKGRMIMAEDNVSICLWSYNKKGYVKEAKRYNKPNNLKFLVSYEYTFWKKKEYRKEKSEDI